MNTKQRINAVRRRRLLIRRIMIVAVALALVSGIILLTVAIAGSAKKPEPATEPPTSEATEPQTAPSENTVDSKYYFDPDSFSEWEKIDLLKYSGQVLPKVFPNPGYIYDSFATDIVKLGSNDKKVIVIDAGHQTQEDIVRADVWMSPYLDPADEDSWVRKHYMKVGATGVSTKKAEAQTTHALALKLKKELESAGFTVYLSHPDIDSMLSAAERAAVANRNNADLMISLHCNFDSEYRSTRGVEVYYPEVYEGYPDKTLSYLSERAAKVFLDEYTAVTGLKKRSVGGWTLTSMFNFCKSPIILVELGYTSNPDEDEALNSEDFQQLMAEGLTRSTCKYFALLKNYGK